MGSQPTRSITERKTRLDGTVTEFSCEPLQIQPGRRAVLRYVTDRAWSVAAAGLEIEPGMVTVAHYWVDRPYNVYHWLARGQTLAFYCNVATDTAIGEDLVAYTDLVVDVVLRTGGAATVLDEDELPADLAPRHRVAIARALEALITDPRTLIREIERETAAALRG